MREHFKVSEAGASENDLAQLQKKLGYKLPNAYLEFLRETNGAEWCVHDDGGNCLQIWKTTDVFVMNESYQVERWLPDVLAIASDGGGRVIILDRSVSDEPYSWPLFRVDLGALDRNEFILVAANFSDWAQREFRLPSD